MMAWQIKVRIVSLALVAPAIFAVVTMAAGPSVTQLVKQVESSGRLCVQLGGGHIGETLALAEDGRMVIHRLESDAERVKQLRDAVASRGLYGAVTVEHLSGSRLPYVDNLVSLVVSSGSIDVPRDEILRVLCPRGIALIRDGDDYRVVRKSSTPGTDDWAHQWHGADGGLTSEDTTVGIPSGLQWMSGPLFAMADRKSSTQSFVSKNGRNFYITQNVLENIGQDPKGQYLVARDAYNGLLLWQRPWSGPFVTGKGEANARIVAGDGALFIGGERSVIVVNAATGETVREIKLAESITKLLVADDRLLVQSDSGLLCYDSSNLEWKFSGHMVYGTVAVDGQVLCLVGGRSRDGGFENDLICLNLSRGKQRWRLDTRPWTRTRRLQINFVRDGYVALQSHGHLHLFSSDDGEHLWSRATDALPGKDYSDERYVGQFYRHGLVWMRTRTLSETTLSEPGSTAAASTPPVQVWDALGAQSKSPLPEGHTGEVTSVRFSPDGRLLASTSADKSCLVWDVARAVQRATLEHTGAVNCVAWSAEGDRLVTGGDDRTVSVWDVASGKRLRQLAGHEESVAAVAVSPDGSTIASASDDRSVRLWDAASGELQMSLEHHSDDVNDVCFSPDGQHLVSVSNDRAINVWNASTGELLRTLKGHTDEINSAAFHPDGSLLATAAEDKTVLVWDFPRGTLRHRLEGHAGDLNAVSFSHDGALLASGGDDGLVIVWDAATGERREEIQPGHPAVLTVAFSPVDKRIATGGEPSATDAQASSFGERDEQLKWLGLDPQTGEVRRHLETYLPWPESASPGKLGCQALIASDAYIMIPRQAAFVDFQTGQKHTFKFLRGGCGLGFVPANGLVYTTPHACGCYTEAIRGFLAVNSATHDVDRGGGADRLRRGPAFATALRREEAGSASEDWPMYRHDPARSGASATPVPLQPVRVWSTSVIDASAGSRTDEWRLRSGNRISAPVVAGGMVFVADVEGYQIVALDDRSGKILWRFAAGGRIDAPPTIHRGLCLFGARDGYVYCLRAGDSELVWRFRAAPADRRIVAFGRLESAWPVSGTVLVQNDTAFVAAGRTADADGGIHVWALEIDTGKTKWKQQVSELTGLCDYLVAAGGKVYLGNQEFDPDTGKHRTNDDSRHLRGGKAGLLETSWTQVDLALRKAIQDWTAGGASGQLLAFVSAADDSSKSTTPKEVFGYQTSESRDGALFATGRFRWSREVAPPRQIRACVAAGNAYVAVGANDLFRDSRGGFLTILTKETGDASGELDLAAPPVVDGIAAAGGRLYVSLQDGSITCFGLAETAAGF